MHWLYIEMLVTSAPVIWDAHPHRNVCLKNQLTNIIPLLCSNRSLVHGRPESGRAEQGLQRSYRRAGASHRQTQTQVWKLRLHCLPSNRFKGLTLFCCGVLTAPYIMTFKVSWLCFTCIFGPMRHSGTYLMCNIDVFFMKSAIDYFNQITLLKDLDLSISVCLLYWFLLTLLWIIWKRLFFINNHVRLPPC